MVTFITTCSPSFRVRQRVQENRARGNFKSWWSTLAPARVVVLRAFVLPLRGLFLLALLLHLLREVTVFQAAFPIASC
jgi:hypothetical protein